VQLNSVNSGNILPKIACGVEEELLKKRSFEKDMWKLIRLSAHIIDDAITV